MKRISSLNDFVGEAVVVGGAKYNDFVKALTDVCNRHLDIINKDAIIAGLEEVSKDFKNIRHN